MAQEQNPADDDMLVASWLHSLMEEGDWEKESKAIADALSNEDLARRARERGIPEGENCRTQYATWLYHYAEETDDPFNNVFLELGEDLAGSTWARAHADDIRRLLPQPITLDGTVVAQLRAMDLDYDTGGVFDTIHDFIW